MIEKITVYDDHLTVEFKSGPETDIAVREQKLVLAGIARQAPFFALCPINSAFEHDWAENLLSNQKTTH